MSAVMAVTLVMLSACLVYCAVLVVIDLIRERVRRRRMVAHVRAVLSARRRS